MRAASRNRPSVKAWRLGETTTWCVIFGLTAIALILAFWMGSASRANEPTATVVAFGLGALIAQGAAALVALKFSRT